MKIIDKEKAFKQDYLPNQDVPPDFSCFHLRDAPSNEVSHLSASTTYGARNPNSRYPRKSSEIRDAQPIPQVYEICAFANVLPKRNTMKSK